MALKRSSGVFSQSSLFSSPTSVLYRMFHIRPNQRRNIFLNILSLIGAYWIITTLISLSNQNVGGYVQRRGLLLKEPVGRQLQLKEEGYIAVDDSKQQQQQQISNNKSRNENLQILRIYGNLSESIGNEKLKKLKQADEIIEEDNNGLEKVLIFHNQKRFVYMEGSPIYKQGDPNQPGEFGVGVKIDKKKLSPEERKLFDEGFKRNSLMNMHQI
ncbi:hypothetical protein WUBG_15807 [Wuchereria bancrofti]|uniref:Transmembrane protein n=1 Tax=Wuchereria bancrofti TaxID=6293 RepID=J9E8H6_WUCBA|nr:hypothetical protein WUBG_15807 [Wuchereria bancrofti]